jgi:hypothetical protein
MATIEPETDEQEPAGAPESDDDDGEGEESEEEPAGPQEPSQEPAVPEAGKPTPAELGAMSARQLEKVVADGLMTPEEVEKALERFDKGQSDTLDKLGREGRRHRDRLAEILREDVLALVPCELCRPDLAGWVDRTQPIPDEVKARVRVQIGDREPENWQPDQYSRRCDTCAGLGEVLTGSQVHGQTTLPCYDCSGKGWTAIGDERRGVVRPLAVPPASTSGSLPEPSAPSTLPAIPPEISAAYVVIPKPQAG